MTSTLRISADVVWMPQRWIFDGVLEGLAAELQNKVPDLSEYLQSETSWGIGYCDLSSLDAASFHTLLHAMSSVYDKVVAEGPSVFNPITGYFHCASSISLFKALLRTDPRAGEEQSHKGTVVVREDATWAAPALFYDMVLEHLAADIQIQMASPEFSMSLLATRVLGGSGECDLRQVDAERFALLVPRMKWMSLRYGEEGGRQAYAPEFYSALTPYVAELAALIHADPRAVGAG
jgi:hypothetical protein